MRGERTQIKRPPFDIIMYFIDLYFYIFYKVCVNVVLIQKAVQVTVYCVSLFCAWCVLTLLDITHSRQFTSFGVHGQATLYGIRQAFNHNTHHSVARCSFHFDCMQNYTMYVPTVTTVIRDVHIQHAPHDTQRDCNLVYSLLAS